MMPHPTEIAAEKVQAVKIVRIEMQKRAAKLRVAQTLEINLRRRKREHAQEERNEQAFATTEKILRRRVSAQREPHARAGEKKEQMQPPLLAEQTERRSGHAALLCFEMPPAGIEETTAVINEDEENGENAEPVEVVAAGRGLTYRLQMNLDGIRS